MNERTASSAGPELALITPARRAAEELAAALSNPKLPSDSFTGYDIMREIHRGGQGVVYQAMQKATKRKVAIKVLREGPFVGPRDKARFEREVQILGQLRHPNIVAIHDCGETAEHFYYVMDYIPASLDTYMARNGRSIEETLRLFVKICEAVNAAHLRGVIHRDLKPGNIRIDALGEPHLLDFGLAKVATGGVTGDSRPMPMTITGQFLGSLPWASPEQASGAPEHIDIRTDVYSLGVILYQMLTGQFPYNVVGNMHDVLDNILKVEPTKPGSIRRQINDEVETIVLRCLRKEPDRRYQSAGELARDIEHYLAGEPIEAKRDSGWYVIRKTLRRHKPKVIAVAALLPILIALCAYGYEKNHRGQAARLVFEGRELEARQRWSEAISKYDAALALDPDCYEAVGFEAHALKNEYFLRKPFNFRDPGLLEEAKRLCDRAIEIKPNVAGTWNLRCQLLRSLDQPLEAEAACRHALELDPNYSWAASNLAHVLAEQRRFDEALQFAIVGAETAAKKPADQYLDYVWLTLGTLQLHLGRQGALESIVKATNVDPKDQRNRLMLARLYLTPEYGEYEKGLKEADRANAFTELRNPRFQRILAQAQLRNSEFEDALTQAEAAIDGGDEPAYGHLILAAAHAAVGNRKQAKEHLRSALQTWPDEFGEEGVIVSAEKGFLWFDTLEELDQLREEAERRIDALTEGTP